MLNLIVAHSQTDIRTNADTPTIKWFLYETKDDKMVGNKTGNFGFIFFITNKIQPKNLPRHFRYWFSI